MEKAYPSSEKISSAMSGKEGIRLVRIIPEKWQSGTGERGTGVFGGLRSRRSETDAGRGIGGRG
jgi:hypothetical protein